MTEREGRERAVAFFRTAQCGFLMDSGADSLPDFLAAKALTMAKPQDYISPLGATPPWRDGAAWKPLTVYAVNHPAMSFGHDGCAGFGGFPLFAPLGGGRERETEPQGSGCLTGESEERETWTAESLRAASSNGEEFFGIPSLQEMRLEETSAVNVSGQHYDRDGEQSPERTEWDLVKVAALDTSQCQRVVACET